MSSRLQERKMEHWGGGGAWHNGIDFFCLVVVVPEPR